jgi:DNA helicase II / ATP-dependent DNA helicase PcrA
LSESTEKNILNETELSFLNEQEKFLEQILESVKSFPKGDRINLADIHKSIESLKEEIKSAKEDDLGGLFYQLNIQQTLAEKFSKPIELPDVSAPYFGYMQLEERGKKKHVFLGHTSFIDPKHGHRVVDWKKAPISSVFYNYDEGEEYELELPNETREGRILTHAILTVERGKLIRVDRNGKSFANAGEGWFNLLEEDVKLEGGEGSATREIPMGTGKTSFKSAEVLGLLDKEQYGLLHKNLHGPLLVIGGAGSGKTTVALHRIASLCAKRQFYPNQVMVVVPHKGLIRLSKILLAKIGLQKVRVREGSEFFETEARRLIDELPRNICLTTPLGASLIKRHVSFMKLLEIWMKTFEQRIADKLEEFSDSIPLDEKFLSMKGAPLSRLASIERQVELTPIQKIEFSRLKQEMFNVRSDLMEIYTDKELLSCMKELSNGIVTEGMINDLFNHTSWQMKDREIEDFTDNTLDGRSVNDGTQFDVQGTIDQEDFPLLFKLLEMKIGDITGVDGSLKKYKHVVLDEAQELSPVELNILSHTITSDGNLTVAGDAAQQVDATISFESWEQTLMHMGIKDTGAHELKISYRSPQSIIDFSHDVLGPYSTGNKPECTRQGAPVKKTTIQHRAHGSMIIQSTIDDLMRREPKASIAIICNKEETAKAFYEELKDLGKVRYVEDSEFSFQPGVDVTTIEQIRGLEFDYVIIPDADRDNYPDDPRARKRLHLAATRAIHQLWVLSTRNWCAYIP